MTSEKAATDFYTQENLIELKFAETHKDVAGHLSSYLKIF